MYVLHRTKKYWQEKNVKQLLLLLTDYNSTRTNAAKYGLIYYLSQTRVYLFFVVTMKNVVNNQEIIFSFLPIATCLPEDDVNAVPLLIFFSQISDYEREI